jgi:putative tryptophan/tyrosine transport system substrate-binding protein
MRVPALGLLVGVLLAFGCNGGPFTGQSPPRVYRIGMLLDTGRQAFEPSIEGLTQGLRELGYVEGENLIVEWRFYQNKPDGIREAAAELVDRPVDLIIAGGTAAAVGAQQASKNVPIVAAGFSNPFVETAPGRPLVASLAHPGGNVTGVTSLAPAVAGKRVQLLSEALSGAKRLAVLSTDSPNRAQDYAEIQQASNQLQAEVIWITVDDPADSALLESAFEEVKRQGTQGIIVIEGTDFLNHRARIIELLARYRLPAIGSSGESAKAGYLMSYSPNHPQIWRRTAAHVDKILKGTNPADIPVEQPTQLDLVVNLKTAQALGLIIPQSIRTQATEIIQ